ncbi:4-hydroxybenzoate transporter [Vibrio neptunius]|uniref:MFS transporter n=1 Tax=Vibrio neptunius TaxID=170651 RepID=UPI0005FA9311|nr:aromatic acid/H+ symport family MFS transporter [Vibrio neptunius]KJY91457.1 4-hydroxybenzoate transporter [Vibrio neptunius]
MSETASTQISHAVRTAKWNAFHASVLFLCLAILILDGFDTALMGYVAPQILQEWGIEKSDLGLAMSAALVGLALGALASGPLSDRLGRKPIILVSVLIFGLCCLATTQATSVAELAWWRFGTGLGIGAAMSNALTIVSEFAPERHKAFMVNAVFCGFPFGAAMSGVLASWMVPHWGWESVFLLGGALPLLLFIPLCRWLPESVLFLLQKPEAHQAITKTLKRLLGHAWPHRIANTAPRQSVGNPVGVIVARSRLGATLLLWLAYFMGLLIFYVVTSWMPILIGEAGYDLRHAALLTALFPLGGAVGTLVSGWVMDRLTPHYIVAFNYFMTGVFLFSIAYLSDIYWLGLAILLAGTVMNGAQASMGSIAALHYPTSARATGVSWMLGMGRAGGIAGAMMGASLLQWGLGYQDIFQVLLVPSVLAALALLGLKQHARRRTKLMADLVPKEAN